MESKKFKDIKKAGLAGIIGNIFLLLIKGAIGLVIILVMVKLNISFLYL